jgi:hypothetical protein
MNLNRWQQLTEQSQKAAVFSTYVQVVTTNGENFEGLFYYGDEDSIILSNS